MQCKKLLEGEKQKQQQFQNKPVENKPVENNDNKNQNKVEINTQNENKQ